MYAMKVRAWQLRDGAWLVLIFMRRGDDLLLMDEMEVANEDAVQEVVMETQRRVGEAMRESGVNGEVVAKLHGAKDA